jgi:hypothetical protein
MRSSQQKDWLTDALESVPSVAFLALWQSQAGLEAAGWTGAALAAAVLIGFRRYRVPYNPILLGINTHLLLATPVIVALYRLGAPDIGRILVGYSHRGVLVTVFLVGCALTLLSQRGFVGLSGLPAGKRQAYSAILLAASAATILWSFVFASGSNTLLTIAVPLMALFGLRRFLIARWHDRSHEAGGIMADAGPAFAAPPAHDAA